MSDVETFKQDFLRAETRLLLCVLGLSAPLREALKPGNKITVRMNPMAV